MLISHVVIKKEEDNTCLSSLKLFVKLEIQGEYDGKGLDSLCGAIQAIKHGMETLRVGIQASEASECNTVIAEVTETPAYKLLG
ncbi:MAG: hypothetical protein WCD86_17955 [Ktedonobacteraceae bacterium]